MLCRSSSSLTTFTPCSVRLTTSGLLGSLSSWEERIPGARSSAPARARPKRIVGALDLTGLPAARRCSPSPRSLYQPLHRGARWHLLQAASKRVDVLELIGAEQLVLTARTAGGNVDRGEDALLGERAIELDLAVSGSLEFLEDHVVHPRAGLDERRRDDGERAAAVFGSNGPRGAEERFRLCHRGRIEATAQGAA